LSSNIDQLVNLIYRAFALLLTAFPVDILRADGIAPPDPAFQKSGADKRKAEDEGEDESDDDDNDDEAEGTVEAELKALLVRPVSLTPTLAFSNTISHFQGKSKSDFITTRKESTQVQIQKQEEGQDRGSAGVDFWRSHRSYLTMLVSNLTIVLYSAKS
jgi:hypothetical protein